VSPPDTSAGFAFTYIGTIHEFQTQSVDLFLRAFALVVRKETALAACRVRICGQRSLAMNRHIETIARELGIEQLVTWQGVIPHSLAVALMKSRGVLLVFSGSSRFMRPSKISDYLASQRPILALAAEDSETARHIRRFDHYLYSGSSPEELAEILTRMWRVHQNDDYPPESFPFPYPHPLHWRTMTMAVASILDRLCDRDREPLDWRTPGAPLVRKMSGEIASERQGLSGPRPSCSSRPAREEQRPQPMGWRSDETL